MAGRRPRASHPVQRHRARGQRRVRELVRIGRERSAARRRGPSAGAHSRRQVALRGTARRSDAHPLQRLDRSHGPAAQVVCGLRAKVRVVDHDFRPRERTEVARCATSRALRPLGRRRGGDHNRGDVARRRSRLVRSLEVVPFRAARRGHAGGGAAAGASAGAHAAAVHAAAQGAAPLCRRLAVGVGRAQAELAAADAGVAARRGARTPRARALARVQHGVGRARRVVAQGGELRPDAVPCCRRVPPATRPERGARRGRGDAPAPQRLRAQPGLPPTWRVARGVREAVVRIGYTVAQRGV
mmetsp:Transcript_10195/g.25429  ORF Transcript_10195/g.25429 Transcript_10195/m.25429 type:complete len:300 (+) Transcript_10195:204-1103(+)